MNELATPTKAVSTDLSSWKPFGDWQILLAPPGVLVDGLVTQSRQTHNGNIVEATALRDDTPADGIILRDSGMQVAVTTADCAPVVVMTDEAAVLLHISRKTLIRGLFDNLFSFIDPLAINYVFVGPHICEYHFGFEKEGVELRQFRYRYPKAVRFHGGLEYVSLRRALVQLFDEHAIHHDRVTFDGRCTFELEDFPSYRRFLAEGRDLSGGLPVLRTVVRKNESN